MRKAIFGGTGAAIAVGLLALLLLLTSQGMNQTAQAENGTGNPPTIFGLDMDPSGNSCTLPVEEPPSNGSCTLGTIQKCIRVESVEAGLYPGPVFEVDVFLNDIPNGKDLAGGDWFMNYNNAYIKVERILPSPARCNAWLLGMVLGSGCADNGEKPTPALPDVDGILNVSMADGNGQVTAELPTVAGQDLGVMDRYQLKVTAAGPIVVPVTFTPAPTYFASSIFGRYDPTQVETGLIAIDTPCPEPTDLKKVIFEAVTETVHAPLIQPVELDVGSTLWFELHERLHNNGPMGAVPPGLLSNLTVEGTPPEGGSVSYHVSVEDFDLPGPLVVTLNGQVIAVDPPPSTVFVAQYPDMLDVHKQVYLQVSEYVDLYEDWDITCLEPSTHVWHFHNEIWPADETIDDPIKTNNEKDLDVTVHCLADSDVDITSFGPKAGTLPAQKAIDKTPPGMLPYPTIYMGDATPITMRKVMTVVSGWSPVDVLVSKTASLSPGAGGFPPAYVGTSTNLGQGCIVLPVNPQEQVELPTDPTLDEVFTVTCGRAGIEMNDDGDQFIDEDPINGIDDDGDNVVGSLCWTNLGPGKCIDEDSGFYIVNLLFQNTLDIKDSTGHISDPSPDYNLSAQPVDSFAYSVVTLTVIRHRSGSFDYIVDSSQPDQTTNPTADNCIASPLFPCKSRSISTVPGSGGFMGDMPTAVSMAVVADYPGEFAWMTSAPWATCPLFGGACPGITNAAKVGKIDFSVALGVAAPCDTPVNGSTDVWDMCMPPPGYAGLTTGTFVPETGCLVDYAGAGPALAPGPINPPNATGEVSWASHLNPVVNLIVAKYPNAMLWGRSAGWAVTAITNIPVNILVFDLGMAGAPYKGQGLGPFLSIGVTGDPQVPTPSVQICTPFNSDTITLGITPNTGGVNTGQIIKYCVVPTGSSHLTHIITGAFTWRDIGETESKYNTITCMAPATDISCDLVKDETPSVPVKLTHQEPVNVVVTNGAGPDNVEVKLSLMGPLACHPEWKSAYSHNPETPIKVGNMQVSKITFHMSDVLGREMNANEVATATLNYAVTCDAGTYELQIISNIKPLTIPDPNYDNNQCENHPVVTAADVDVDDDTVVNWVDNCPEIANADQANNDGDALGDVCDTDDDNDTILDGPDVCDFRAEDMDGDNDGDGCPETDVSISVDRALDIDVDVSTTKSFTVKATATNGNYGLYAPDGVEFRELLKSNLTNPADKCEAHWVCLPGDNCVEDTLCEDWASNGYTDSNLNGVPDCGEPGVELVLYSQLETVIPNVPAFGTAVKTRQYQLHCNARSDHQIFLEESAVPTWPVTDNAVANNVDKKYIAIEAWEYADVKEVSSSFLNPPTSVQAGVPFNLTVRSVVHNNGPVAAKVMGHIVLNLPNDCTTTSPNPRQGETPLLVPSVNQIFDDTWTVTCTNASSHTFTANDGLDPITTVHVIDPNLNNNSASASVSFPVIGTTVVAIQQTVNGVADIDVSEDVPFTVDKIIQNQGAFPANPKVDQVMTPPADCELSFHVTAQLMAKVQNLSLTCNGVVVPPPTPYGWEPSDTVWCPKGQPLDVHFQVALAASQTVNLTEEWDKHCYAPSQHSFSLSMAASRDAAKDPHVLFAGSQETDTWSEDVWADADVKILDWYFRDADKKLDANSWLVKVVPSSWRYVHEKEVIHNNGPYGPVDLLETISASSTAGCGVSYTVTGKEAAIYINGGLQPPLPVGTNLQIQNPNTLQVNFNINGLPVSIDLWQADLWDFHIAPCDGQLPNTEPTQCKVSLHKEITGLTGHVRAPNATKDIDMTVCADTDADTIADNCPALGEKDNCTAVSNPDQKDSDGDGLGDKCDKETNLALKYCMKFGPAPANLSDTQGRYMWTICEIGNPGQADQTVKISLDVTGAPAAPGCTQVQQLILPGQDTFVLTGFEQKWVLYRDRYECHSPAIAAIYPLNVKFCVEFATGHTPNDDDDNDGKINEDPINGIDDDGDSRIDEDPPETLRPLCEEQIRTLIVHSP